MIKGLQGTMITGEEAMMTADPLIIIMTDAGTNQNDAETTGDATRKMSATTIGRGTQTVMADGRVEWILVRYRARDKKFGRRSMVYFPSVLDFLEYGVVV